MLEPVQVSQSPIAKFREYLTSRASAQRFTAQQERLVDYIFSAHNHFDAEQLCTGLNDAKINVSRATVYRTLSKLVDAGLLRTLQFGNRTAYEHDYGYPQHEHLYCQKCGKVIEFQCPNLESMYGAVCRKHQFRPESHNLIIRGTCATCNRSQIPKRRLDLI